MTALMGLREAATDNPDRLIAFMEAKLHECNARGSIPVDASRPPDVFFYMEHRSMITGYRSHIKWGWILGHIIKALHENRPRDAARRASRT